MEFYDLVGSVTIQSDIEVWNLDADDNEEFVFALDNVDDLGLCFYPENFNVFCEVAFVYVNNNGKLIIEVRNAWDQTEDPSGIMVEYKIEPEVHEPSEYERALLSINRAYDMENYDLYEDRIERVARKFDKSYNQVEDDATDVRMFGVDGN